MATLKVLFVDNDMLVLKALQRAARRIRPDWQILLCDDPSGWQQQITQAVDVVVCDYLMLGLRGNELLQQVREAMPSAIRVLLTGDTSPTVLESLNHCSHFMIGKPYTEQDLAYLFACAERLQKLPFTADERHYLGGLQELPVMPKLLIKFKRIMREPEVDLEKLTALISHDAVLSGKLLQYANSAFFGFGRKTTSLFEAIMRLGSKLTEAIVTSMLVDKTFAAHIPVAVLRSINDAAFQHAQLARQIVETLDWPTEAADDIFSAAMLSGLGRLIVAARLQHQALLKPEMVSGNLSLTHFENSALVSAYILTLWGYPDDFCNMVLKQDTAANEHNEQQLKQFILFITKHWLLANGGQRRNLLSMIETPALHAALQHRL
ncbi:HDOD domain-containing protein [Shewanella sp.]|uniref:HDOD domain-containing protein n=1 Tax=Shewanella sp. TaxID=50422 RepID=UPI003A98119B